MYRELGAEYVRERRRFVPGYDTLVQSVVNEVLQVNPQRILDVGAGVGNIDERILEVLPQAHITAVEPKYAPIVQKLFKGDITIIEKKVHDVSPEEVAPESYDAAICNLVLHNIPLEDKKGRDKQAALKIMYDALRQGGTFVWGDLIDYDSKLQEVFVGLRHLHAFVQGARYKHVIDVMKKEREEDSKLSIDASIGLCEKLRFKNVRVLTTSYVGTWAAFAMEK
ncbi:class I SAM-dependent methyltransferase [Candidatus Woesearchaeota archaeon]|nr:class I SAM-dependent methyltransferase [Candidatus Woesearchaeota archaeon]